MYGEKKALSASSKKKIEWLWKGKTKIEAQFKIKADFSLVFHIKSTPSVFIFRISSSISNSNLLYMKYLWHVL